MFGFISTSVTSSLNHTSIQPYRQFAQFPISVAHALGFPVFTSRLLATDFNTETSTSNHYEVFLLFLLQLLWNLGTEHSHTSSLRLTRDCPWTNSVTAFTSLTNTLHRPHGKHRLYCCWRHFLRGCVFSEPLLRTGLHNSVLPPLLGADYIENTASLIVACWTVFTEVLPGKALIRSVTLL
jgi:hypothetical protein